MVLFLSRPSESRSRCPHQPPASVLADQRYLQQVFTQGFLAQAPHCRLCRPRPWPPSRAGWRCTIATGTTWSFAGRTPGTSTTRTDWSCALACRGAMGSQVHAARSLRAGDLLVRIPLALALSHSHASRLPVGRAVAAFVQRRYRPKLFPYLSPKALARGAMLMVMIANRCTGVGPWREYVHTLPDRFDDSLWWPQALVDALPQVRPHEL